MNKKGWAYAKNLGEKRHYYKYEKAACGITQSKDGMLRGHKEVLSSSKCKNCLRVLKRENCWAARAVQARG